jgi:WXG100 family type VII secretion target
VSGVADLPGGGALTTLLAKVDGKPAEIRKIAGDWRDAAGGLADPSGRLAGAVGTVDAAWQGASADAFVTYMGAYGRAADGLGAALRTCAQALDDAATTLELAHSAVAGICRDVAARAAAYRTAYLARHPGADPADADAGIGAIVAQGVAAAQQHADQATAAVRDAKRVIAATLGADYRSGRDTFAAIRSATDQGFVPEPGRSGDWQRTPGYRGPGDVAPAAYTTLAGDTPAASIAAGGAGGFGGYGPSGAPPAGGGPAPTGQVREWIEQALETLRAAGYSPAKMNADDIWTIIRYESGGNPHAINLWDSNAAAGHPSKGLMQTIDPTFGRWSLPGHKDIWNPVDNIIAGVRYAIARYGSVSAVPGVIGMKTGTGYRGY